MAISVENLKFYMSERMQDFSDGGGMMTGTEIVSGTENQIFDDVTDQDRAAGDVSIRKVYAAVTSADTDKYLDAGVVLFAPPADPAVSVLAFSTGSFYDERDDLQNRIEQTISRGVRFNGWLYGTHLAGQRAVLVWQRIEAALPHEGGRLVLVAQSGGVQQYEQYVWVTRVSSELRTMYEVIGSETVTYVVRVLTLEIAEPLTANYTGIEPARADPVAVNASTLIYDTRYNAEAVPLYGVSPLVANADLGDFSVQIDDLYTPLIPTAFTETALPDVNPGGDSPALVSANASTINFTTTTQCVKPDASLYLGMACAPGTLSIAVSSTTLHDDNGEMKSAAGTVIGSIDYANGVAAFNSACPNYAANSKTVTFTPAARPLRVADTAAQKVTVSNRGFVWVLTLSPIPAPKTLRVSYRVNNQWYVIEDRGGGIISGVDSSYGSGSLNFSTGTVTITTGALPDVDSEIIYAWGTPVNYTKRGGAALDAPVVRGQTEHAGVAPGTVTVSWTYSGAKSVTDDGHGVLSGSGGSGGINYVTGAWWVRPTLLPNIDTEFTIAYDYGAPYEDAYAHPIREGNGHLALTLSHANVRADTVEVEWNLLIEDYEAAVTTTSTFIPPATRRIDPTKIVRDNGSGGLVISGGSNGTINYSAGTLDFLPDVTIQIPKPNYSPKLLGTSSTSLGGGGTVVTNTYRTTFDGFTYVSAGAAYPNDETGYVKVRYRVTGGDSSTSEVVTLSQLEMDLTKGYGEIVVASSVRFRIGTDTFVDTAGQLYRNPAPDTGAGTLAGSLDPSAGVVRISNWTAGATNTVTLDSLLTDNSSQPIEEAVFRTPVSPLKPGTLQLRATTLTGTVISKTVDSSGLLEDSDCTIQVVAQLGVVRARWGAWKVDADLTTEEKLETWYNTGNRVTIGGIVKIWKPKPVLADTVIYNAVAQTFLPPDSALLGLDAARLPPDGKALIYNTGRLVLVHHTDSIAEGSLSPTQVINCGRIRLYRVVIEDVTGKRLGADQYTVDRILGTVTMSPTLNLTGFSAPYVVLHTVADLARLVSVDINGTLALNKALTHDYPENEARCSAVLPLGTLQARVLNLFAQSTWTSVWSDTLIGSEPLAQFNDVQHPLVVENAGAYTDRMLIKFTSSTDFQVIGENLGIIGIGDITHPCAPVNVLTGQPFFTIPYQGWGAGWSTGNCLRFNLQGASYPIDLIRAVQPSSPTGEDPDQVELLLIGNVNA